MEKFQLLALILQYAEGVGQALMDYAEQLAKKHNCIGTWLVSGTKE